MAYFAPYIDTTGLHFPEYNDIVSELMDRMRSIYGQDIYLENDSQDYQMLSAIALMIFDTLQFSQFVYDSYSVKKSIGVSLDDNVKLNGLIRKSASYSTVHLQLTGTIGSVINRGVVRDTGNNLWNLDDEQIVFTDTTIFASATCQRIGAIQALPNSITQIVTPTKGWLSVTNPEKAVAGAPVETDLQLKERQSLSVAISGTNMVDSLYSRIMALDNVQTCVIYDNDTNQTDNNGVPAHSVACVVEGGSNEDVANTIFQVKGAGSGTYGDIEIKVSTITGLPIAINFFRPSEVFVDIQILIIPSTRYNSATEQRIKDAVTAFFNNIRIGSNITRASLLTVISQVAGDVYNPEFQLTLPIYTAISGNPLLNQDTEITFTQRASLGTFTILGTTP